MDHRVIIAARLWNHDRYYTLQNDEIYAEKPRKIFLPFSKEDAFEKQKALDEQCWTELYSAEWKK